MNRPDALPFSAGADWLDRAWVLWCGRPWFFASTALVVLALRWLSDVMPLGDGAAALILVSYLTDALVLAAAWAALTHSDAGAGLRRGWAETKGRRLRIAGAGLWGLPAAACSYLLLGMAPPVFEALGVAIGARLASWLLLAWIFLVGWLCCAWLFAALMAAITALRGENRLWAMGMAGLSAAWAGRFPLLAVWTAFVCGAAAFAALSAGLLGHLSFDVVGGPARDALEYWINWPALFVAVMALCALMVPVAESLLGGARAPADDERQLRAFGETMARRFGQGLQGLGGLLLLSGFLVIDLGPATVLVGSLGLFLTGRAAVACAPAWGDPDAGLWARWKWLVLRALPAAFLWLGTLG